MLSRAAVRQVVAPARAALVALLLGALAAGAQAPAEADSASSATQGLAPSEPPVIAAPDDPGRQAPGALNFAAPEAGGLNSFLSADLAPSPPMDVLGAPAQPVVVELFTSQGCSSCPPADAMLERLAAQPGVLPLSFHVDYWDYLGWADRFARPEFTRRQEGYARAAGERALFTPQLIVDGRDTAFAPGPAQLMALIDASRVAPAMVSVQRDSLAEGEAIELLPLSELGGPVDVLLVRYAPRRQVEVTEGENRGRLATSINVVLGMDRLAQWDGTRPLRMTVRPDQAGGQDFPADTRHVLIVQRALRGDDLPGPILAAIRLD